MVVGAVESVLSQPAYLTAYVAYLRTPGDKGAGAHCDYKRWRPVGSSMNWVFAIIPLTDFDVEHGPFLVSPKSHKLTQVIDKDAHILDLTRPDAKQLAPFIDPELKAGDLLVVNEHVWHKAPAGTTTEDRCGIFNKYCAVNAPPAAGYYPYNPVALDALSDDGKRLIPICFDKPITTTRLLIEDTSSQESKFLLHCDGEWKLPGGEGWEEEKLVGWDVGARIGSLQEIAKTQLGLDVPWMSYIEDVEAEDGSCRGSTVFLMTPSILTHLQVTVTIGLRNLSCNNGLVRVTLSTAPLIHGIRRILFAEKARRAIKAASSLNKVTAPCLGKGSNLAYSLISIRCFCSASIFF